VSFEEVTNYNKGYTDTSQKQLECKWDEDRDEDRDESERYGNYDQHRIEIMIRWNEERPTQNSKYSYPRPYPNPGIHSLKITLDEGLIFRW